jgi:anti-sigma regulatory factor (Ser/Thr protein kinase)
VSQSARPAPRPGSPVLPVPRPAHDAAPRTGGGRSATMRLPGTGKGCAQAREFTERVLDEWQLGECRSDALTVVSELAANALVHGRRRGAGDSQPDVWLRLSRRGNHLVCAVTDQGEGLPRMAPDPDPFSEHGRGLFIVESLSRHWGWTRHNSVCKTVWAMLPTQAHV